MTAPKAEAIQTEVCIVGAGISGIGAACHLQRLCPHAPSYIILDRRHAVGGTWDAFKYPALLHHCDFVTLCCDGLPLCVFVTLWACIPACAATVTCTRWATSSSRGRRRRALRALHLPLSSPTPPLQESIADGSSILNYLQQVVRALTPTSAPAFAHAFMPALPQVSDNKLEQHMALGVTVASADWDHATRCWTLVMRATARDGATSQHTLRCSLLFMCSGYFSYDTPHDPEFPGFHKFKGTTLHPQFWPQPSPALQGKQVVVVGSGATAMTIVPALANDGVNVTMLQVRCVGGWEGKCA